MKNSKIFYLLITLLVVSCNTAEDVEVIYDNEIIEQEESSTEQSTQVVEEKQTEVLVTTETLELDRKYRDDSNFILPTFNGNCPHSRQSIIDLFDYWNKEFAINLTYNISGYPATGTAAKNQLPDCLDMVIGSNKDQNLKLEKNIHIELVIGRELNLDIYQEDEYQIQQTTEIQIPTTYLTSLALHPTNSELDLISNRFGEIFNFNSKELIYSVDDVGAIDYGGFLAIRFTNDGNYLISMHNTNTEYVINLYEIDQASSEISFIKTLKSYSLPEYTKCNDFTLLLAVYEICNEIGTPTVYVGAMGGGIEIGDNNIIYASIGNAVAPSSIYSSLYTSRNADLPWGSILKFEFDSDDLELEGIGYHETSNLDEVWVIGMRNPYRISLSNNNLWIADVGSNIQDEINFVSTESNNLDLGFPYIEGNLSHGPFTDDLKFPNKNYKKAILAERIGGLIGGHPVNYGGYKMYTYGVMNGDLFGIKLLDNGMVKTKIIYDDKTFESENALLSIERSRNGIYLLTLNGTVVKIDNS